METLTVDNVTKIVLGQKLSTMKQDLNRIDNEIQLKRREVAAISQLAQTYSTNPEMGKASDPLEVREDPDRIAGLVSVLSFEPFLMQLLVFFFFFFDRRRRPNTNLRLSRC
jgi:hypothetical protein